MTVRDALVHGLRRVPRVRPRLLRQSATQRRDQFMTQDAESDAPETVLNLAVRTYEDDSPSILALRVDDGDRINPELSALVEKAIRRWPDPGPDAKGWLAPSVAVRVVELWLLGARGPEAQLNDGDESAFGGWCEKHDKPWPHSPSEDEGLCRSRPPQHNDGTPT